jgi:hypothetical protein
MNSVYFVPTYIIAQVRLSSSLSPNCASYEKTARNRVPLEDTTQRKLLVVLLRAWIRAQATQFAHYFRCKKGIRIVITMGLLLQYGRTVRNSVVAKI